MTTTYTTDYCDCNAFESTAALKHIKLGFDVRDSDNDAAMIAAGCVNISRDDYAESTSYEFADGSGITVRTFYVQVVKDDGTCTSKRILATSAEEVETLMYKSDGAL